MSLAKKKDLFTYQDLLHWEDDNYRHEIIKGEHCTTPSPQTIHQKIVVNLLLHLKKHFDDNKLGVIFVGPTDIVFSDIDVLVPDILFISKKRKNIIGEKYIKSAPDLIIKVLSPNTAKRDKELKFERYQKYGVKEYWIVDPGKQQIKVYDLVKNKLINTFLKSDTLNISSFSDINLDLHKIFL